MSITTDIANLVARADALMETYDAKKAAIDAAVAAAVLAVPAATRTVYLDAISGNDNNDGSTTLLPVQTLSRALALGSAGRGLNIGLMSDVTLSQARYMLALNQQVRVFSHNSLEGSVKRKIILTTQPATTPVDGDWEVSGFYCPTWGLNTLNLESVEVVFPPTPATGTMVLDNYNGLLSSHGNSGPPLVGLEMNFSTLTRPAGSVGVLCGVRTHFVALMVKSTIYTSGEMAGKWLAGVAANTTPSSIGWVASNLSSL